VKVEFNYIIAHSVKQYVRFQTQASRAAYPGWVTGFVYAMIGISVGGLTYGLFYLFSFALSYLNIDQPLISILIAVGLAIQLSTRLIIPNLNKYLIKFARFDVDHEFTSRFHIDAQGLMIDETDRQTQIAWSAIGGVFQTKDFIVFYCRGLFYNVPHEHVGDQEAQQALLERCKVWQTAAQSHKTAKAFI
jgi:hypothetical protein